MKLWTIRTIDLFRCIYNFVLSLLNVSNLCNLHPWRRPHGWPKHVSVHYVHNSSIPVSICWYHCCIDGYRRSFSGMMRSGREVHQSPWSSAEKKELVDVNFYSPYTPSWHGQIQLYLLFGILRHRSKYFPVNFIINPYPANVENMVSS